MESEDLNVVKIAIIGPELSGKSFLFNLILNLPTEINPKSDYLLYNQ